MMVDVQNSAIFLNPLGTDFTKLRMSSNTSNWFDNTDISAFLNVTEDVLEFPQSVPSSSPTDMAYYSTSSPETNCSDSSPYSSDVSQTPSPFDASLFQESPQPFSVDTSLFEPCNLTNPLLLPEIERILAANPFQQTQLPLEVSQVSQEPNSKKRHREIDCKTEVTLSRDQLLTMSSKEIEDYVASLKSKRTLTASEEKDLKRQRRLVKNREYASQSRSRKKQYVDELEKQLEQARAETDAFKKQNHMLMEENKILKRQLGSIADTIKKSQNGHAALSSSSGSVGVFAKFASIGGGRPSAAPTKTVSACLLAIFFMVFTFAAFWDNEPLGLTLYPNQYTRHQPRTLKAFGNDDVSDLYSPPPTPTAPHPPTAPHLMDPPSACRSLLPELCSPCAPHQTNTSNNAFTTRRQPAAQCAAS